MPANQLRLFLHADAYWLMWTLRAALPRRSPWRRAQFDTLCLRLIKIAARVVEMKTRITVHLPSAWHRSDDRADRCPRPPINHNLSPPRRRAERVRQDGHERTTQRKPAPPRCLHPPSCIIRARALSMQRV